MFLQRLLKFMAVSCILVGVYQPKGASDMRIVDCNRSHVLTQWHLTDLLISSLGRKLISNAWKNRISFPKDSHSTFHPHLNSLTPKNGTV